MSQIDFDCFSVSLNIWQDDAAEFRKEFRDEYPLNVIADTIVKILNTGLDRDGYDPTHPFNRYAIDLTEGAAKLRTDVRNAISDPTIRSNVSSFFHSSGYRDETEDLLTAFATFADDSVPGDGIWGSESDSEEESPNNEAEDADEDEAEDESESESEEVPGNAPPLEPVEDSDDESEFEDWQEHQEEQVALQDAATVLASPDSDSEDEWDQPNLQGSWSDLVNQTHLFADSTA